MSAARHVPKIDPSRRAATGAGLIGEVDAAANPGLGEWIALGLEQPDMAVVRAYRLQRIRTELAKRDVAGALLYDPLNIRYALDAPNMQVWCTHNPARYAFIATEGPVVLFDFHACGHLSNHLPLIDERRPAISWFYMIAGTRELEMADRWAAELAGLVKAHGGGNARLAIDKCDAAGIAALQRYGIEPIASQAFTEEARKIKHPEEIKAMRRAIATTEIAMEEMWRVLEPGITENQLWSLMHQANIARGGEWIETRLLASGERTNPWFHECSDRVIEAGDMVAFDTDLIGPYGYCCDISRSWVAPGRVPTNEQVTLHAIAKEQIAYNMDLMRPGLGFRELAEKGYTLDPDIAPNRYAVMLHGVGLCDEYPTVRYPMDWDAGGHDGVFEPGMCVCFESYIGRVGGKEGVKLESQVLITETGWERLDNFSDELVPAL